jgi:hypothetical protein
VSRSFVVWQSCAALSSWEADTRGDGEQKGHTMNSRNSSMLRTKLRQVNVEYSALVRDKSGESRFVRMGELRTERRVLMALLFGGKPRAASSAQQRLDVGMQHAAD